MVVFILKNAAPILSVRLGMPKAEVVTISNYSNIYHLSCGCYLPGL